MFDDLSLLNIDYTLEPNGKTPEYGDYDAAGADLFLNMLDNTVLLPYEPLTDGKVYQLKPHTRTLLSLGVSFAIPRGYYGKVFDRSGIANKLGLITSAGVIDSNYRGVVKVILYNTSDKNVLLEHHMKITQIVFHKYYRGNFKQVEKLSETDRGTNGFGSTGI